jgi:chromosome segregation ATPase
MDAVLKGDQAQKLQLQLDIQTAADEDQRKKLQDQLQRLNEKEDARRDQLRQELSAQYDAERKAEIAKHSAELRAYQAKVEGEARAQIQARHAAVLGRNGISSTGPTTVNNIKTALEARQRELKAQFEAHKNQLVGELQAASAAAQETLKKRRADIEKKLKEEQQRILTEAIKAGGKISKEEQARRDHLKAQLDELKAQRDRVYDGIVAQIRDNVKKLAAEKHVPLVVGDYRVNLKCQDLTDLALKQAAGTSASAAAPQQ